MTRRHRRQDGTFGGPGGEAEVVAGGVPEGAEPVRVPTSGPTPSQAPSETDRLIAMLRQARDGGCKIGIERVRPTHIKGWLETVVVPGDVGTDWLYDTVQRSWGGGGYRFRPMDQNGNFAAGGVTVEIGGPPKFKGAAYMPDGSIVQPNPYAQQPAPQMPIHMQPPGRPPENPGVVQALSGLVSTLVQGKGSDQAALLEKQMADLRSAVSTAATPPAAPLSNITETIALLKEIRGLDFGGMDSRGGGDDDGDPGGVPAMPKSPEDLMYYAAAAWLGKQQQQPQQPMGQWVQTPQGPMWMQAPPQPMGMPGMPGMPPGMMPPGMPPGMPGAPAAPPQNPMQQFAAMAQAQGMTMEQAMAMAQANGMMPGQPATPPAAPAAPPIPTAAPTDAAEDDEDDGGEWEDITAEHVVNRLAEMDPQQAAAFFDHVGANLPPAAAAALAAKFAAQGGSVIPMPGTPAAAPVPPQFNAYDDSKPSHG